MEIKEENISIKEENQQQPQNQNINNTTNANLPMNWYYFLIYFSIPVGILTNGCRTFLAIEEEGTFISCILCLLFTIFLGFLEYSMVVKRRNALNLLIAYAIITFILEFFTYLPYGADGFFQFLGSALALCAIYYPNYIYFNKRKHLFIN